MANKDFGYWAHPVDAIEPAPDHSCSNTALATARLFDQVVGSTFRRSNRGPAADTAPMFRRFLALLWLLDPDRYFEGRNERQVAEYLGVTRSAFSRIVRELAEKLGLRNRHMKREGALPVYSKRQERIWRERRANREAQLYLNVVYR